MKNGKITGKVSFTPSSKIGGTLLVVQLVEALRNKSEDRGFDSL